MLRCRARNATRWTRANLALGRGARRDRSGAPCGRWASHKCQVASGRVRSFQPGRPASRPWAPSPRALMTQPRSPFPTSTPAMQGHARAGRPLGPPLPQAGARPTGRRGPPQRARGALPR
eukprot:355791-Chlamydomonas_euryale.AAC.11